VDYWGVRDRYHRRVGQRGVALAERGRQLRRPYFLCSGWSAAFCASKSAITTLIRSIVSWSLIKPDILRYRRTISSSSAHLSHMSDPHSRANGGPRWPQYYKTTDRRNCSNQASQNQTRPLGAGPYFGACNSKKEPHVIQKAACLATCIEHPMWWPVGTVKITKIPLGLLHSRNLLSAPKR
jgi:hypothetical protein